MNGKDGKSRIRVFKLVFKTHEFLNAVFKDIFSECGCTIIGVEIRRVGLFPHTVLNETHVDESI